MQRADHPDIKSWYFIDRSNSLHSVFAYDVRVIAACLILKLGIEILVICKDRTVDRAIASECIGGEEDSVCLIEAHHYLRPVNHGSKDELESVCSEIGLIAVLYDDRPCRIIPVRKELRYELKSLRIYDDLCFGILIQNKCKRCRMVRLHVMDYHIVERAAWKAVIDILYEQIAEILLDRIDQYGCSAIQKIRIVIHSGIKLIDILEPGDLPVDCTDPCQSVCYLSCVIHNSPYLSSR